MWLPFGDTFFLFLISCIFYNDTVHTGPREGTQQMFMREGSDLRSNPLPFYIPFSTKKVILSCTFY